MVSWCTFDRRYYQQLPLPWDTILVRLDEGPLFVSNPSGVDRSELSLGMRVKVGFIDCHDDAGEFRLPVFGPDPAAQEPRD